MLLRPPDVWTPITYDGGSITSRGAQMYVGVARLKPGATAAQAQLEMDQIASRLSASHPATNAGAGINLVPMQEYLLGGIRTSLLVLVAAVAFVLLIACANVANLLLGRAASRQKEIAIRTAMGASRWRIIRQLLIESMMLSILGAAAGLLLALWGVNLLVQLGPDNIARLKQVRVDSSVLAFTFAVSLLTGIIFGLAPAVHASRLNINESLKEGGRGVEGGPAQRRLRNLLVVAEVTLAIVLLAGAGLLVRSFVGLMNVDPGFAVENVLTMRISLPRVRYKEDDQVRAFYDQALDRIRALPGVEAAAKVNFAPMSSTTFYLSFAIEGRTAASAQEQSEAQYRSASVDYFRLMRIPLRRGRGFTEADGPNAAGVAVINEAMARQFWPGEEPLGKRISLRSNFGEAEPEWREIVGVIADIRHFGLAAEPRPEMYVPEAQQPSGSATLLLRASSDPQPLAGLVKAEIAAIDKDLPVSSIATLEENTSRSIARPRFIMLLLATFASIALLLAAVGIYGVVSYSVSQRTREIGIRMALGAERSDIIRLVIMQGMMPAGLGVVAGLVAAFGLTRLMESLLFGVSAADPLTFAGVPVILTGVALAACFVPARRATRVNPMVALRHE